MDGVQLQCNNCDDDDDDDEPDIIVHKNKIRTCMLIDVANPGDKNEIKIEAEKVL